MPRQTQRLQVRKSKERNEFVPKYKHFLKLSCEKEADSALFTEFHISFVLPSRASSLPGSDFSVVHYFLNNLIQRKGINHVGVSRQMRG
jgi:hypothetical protein